MSAFLELAERLEQCPACSFHGTPGSLKFIAGFAMTEKDRDLILAALRGADALRALADLPPRHPVGQAGGQGERS